MGNTTIELPSDPTIDYVVPDGVTIDDLTGLLAAAQQKAQELLADDNATVEDIELAERYIAATTVIQQRQTQLADEAAEHKKKLEDARARAGAAGGEAETDPAAGGGPGVPAAEPGSDQAVVPAGEPLLVAGAGQPTDPPAPRRSAVAAAASAGDPPEPPANSRVITPAYLVAAADTRGVPVGESINWATMGSAALQKFKMLPTVRPGGREPRTVLPIGACHIPTHDTQLVAAGALYDDFIGADDAIEWAVSHHRLQETTGEDSLVAAGGWCAPSETLYDLLDITTDDGMLDVPGITVTRGGVRYSLGPDFTAVYVTNNANFTRTEAQAIAGSPTKPMVNIPCPSFSDNRMVVDGLYLTGDILSSRGYPEAYADYVQKAMKAFAHYVNALSIADQVGLSGTLIDLSASTGTLPVTNRTHSAVVELLGAVELQITDMRYKNRLSMTQMVEVVLPFWAKGNIRTDIAKRQGYENAMMVSDSDITAWFALRSARVQFVYDWQDAFTGVSGGFGSATAIGGWPTTVTFLIYPEGTFVRALDPVIELNAVYDSVLLQTNQYVALFMEQGRLTLKRHWDARQVKIDFSPLGGTSAGSPVGAAGLTGAVL